MIHLPGASSIAGNLANWITDILGRYHDRLPFRPAAFVLEEHLNFVPEGHLKIARRFNAEMVPETSRVPEGRLKTRPISRSITKDFNRLVELGIAVQIGRGRSTRYRLKPSREACDKRC